MVNVKPFVGVRYNQEKVAIEKVVAPPYDVTGKKDKERLRRNSRYNIVRVDSPFAESGENRYNAAGELLEKWMEEEVLITESKPCFYYYAQEYTFGGRKKRLSGLIGLLELEEYGENVFPHEHTLSQPKRDRLELLRHTQCSISPLYTVYQDRKRVVEEVAGEEKEPLYQFSEEFGGTRIKHCLWRLCSEEALKRIPKLMKHKKIFIADGHHRYETALAYKREREKGREPLPSSYALCFFANFEQEGFTILSSHRLLHENIDSSRFLREASGYFSLERISSSGELVKRIFSEEGGIGFFSGRGLYLLRLKDSSIMDELIEDRAKVWKKLDVVVLHELLIKKIAGVRDENAITYHIKLEKTMDAVKQGKASVAFFLKPPSLKEVRDVSFAGEKMSGKATYFFPKLLTGLVLYCMDA